MKAFLLAVLISLVPISSLFIVNETVRLTTRHTTTFNGAERLNSSKRLKEKCTWACHDGMNPTYCRQYHVKYLSTEKDIVYTVYSFIVSFLDSAGNYYLANILVLVLLIPLIMFIMLVKTLQVTFKIKELQKR